MQNQSSTPHVLIFPLPLQGPVNCMLKLAQLLCLQNIQITFLNTLHIQQRLQNCTNDLNYFQKYKNFRFITIPDGLEEGNPRGAEQIGDIVVSIETTAVPFLKEMMGAAESESPLTCIIADGVYTFAVDLAKDIGVPLFYFDTISPCGLWTYLCLPKLIQLGELPFIDDNLDEFISYAPGMEGIIRRRDLPSFCRTKDLNDSIVQLVLKEDKHIPLAHGLIFNTFQQLESPILSQMLNICPNVYAVGPLHSHLTTKLGSETSSTSSIWKEDKSCITWLDSQPRSSVIYVSIGSLAVMAKEQFLEIWYGLVNSGSKFLWVQRPNSIIGLELDIDEIPLELVRGTEERGKILSWAPQEEVLAHSAVGCFLTHSGWNSTLECLVEGKPMICWPYFVDQQVNSRYVEEVWKIGLDMKDTCDREIVENKIREVMEFRKEEFLKKGEEWAKLAKESVNEGGSSSEDLNRLVQDIKLMKMDQILRPKFVSYE